MVAKADQLRFCCARTQTCVCEGVFMHAWERVCSFGRVSVCGWVAKCLWVGVCVFLWVFPCVPGVWKIIECLAGLQTKSPKAASR